MEIEEYHKSLKHNASLAKSPTKTIITQSNHIFLSIMAFFKLETLKIKHHLNHFALKPNYGLRLILLPFMSFKG